MAMELLASRFREVQMRQQAEPMGMQIMGEYLEVPYSPMEVARVQGTAHPRRTERRFILLILGRICSFYLG